MLNYSTYNDQQLLELLKTGDKRAYAEIYNRYKKLLYAFALKRLDNEQEVEDILHELFLSVWNKREQFGEQTLLAAYLYNGVRYQIINIFSRQKLAGRYLDSFNQYLRQELTIDETDHLIRHKELSGLIEKEIAALPTKMREVFQMSRQIGCTRKEIAEQLGLSEETVKSHMHHALKILKVKLGTMTVLLFM
ncbi:RNA polymerase sigma-70 factor [Pedobacter frigoris]|uniref:RNA polymerase sigma factor n=1 Tax=Pedobacter frigoris TaxID=2571272 RepID=UPI00292E0F8C|nr:RNA polymerase sigma-70 factor [Pedobacter frigoris]